MSFWFDKWSNQGTLRNIIQGPLTRESIDLKVRDVVLASGWDWSRIPFELPLTCRMKIQAIPVSVASTGEDRLMWIGGKRGEFNLNSAYIATAELGPPQFLHDNCIWRLNILPKIQIFLWKCHHNNVGVGECLRNKGMDIDPSCPLCHANLESYPMRE